MLFTRRIITLAAILYVLAQVFFLINHQFPLTHNFDEFHYVPSAKQFRDMVTNQNWEHPPLGKEIMAVGIAVFGDNQTGWRIMSTVFGALTLVGMYLWGLALFRNERAALITAGITFFNQLLYVQSRIGMLDTFMMAFLVWALTFFTAAWDNGLARKRQRQLLISSGILFGLAVATKWFAIMPWFFCILLVVIIRTLQGWGTSFTIPSPWRTKANKDYQEWYEPRLFAELRRFDIFYALGLIPLLVYFLTFIPFLFINPYTFSDYLTLKPLIDILKMQPAMYDGQLRVVNTHPYMSEWKSWALMKRPIWYAYEKDGENHVRGVILLGNPLIMWAGLLAVAGTFWIWLKKRSRESFLIVMFYSCFYFSWALIPRKVSFYYYYYPAAMALSLALAYVFLVWERKRKFEARVFQYFFLIACAIFFFYFFPILSAQKIEAGAINRMFWFKQFPGWI